jgi:hypothetical protein
MATREVEAFNPEVDHQQLQLDGDAFRAIVALAEAGAITPTSLDLSDPELPFETYEALGAYLGRMNRSCSWWIGDWLVFGEGAYGEKFAQAVHATGLAEQTLLNRAYVSRNVARSLRRAAVPFSVHAEVAPLPPREQKRWLDRAEKQAWTRADLRAAMKARRTETEPPEARSGEPVEGALLEEVARAILRDAREHDDPGFYLIPAEDVARLRAALGEEQE